MLIIDYIKFGAFVCVSSNSYSNQKKLSRGSNTYMYHNTNLDNHKRFLGFLSVSVLTARPGILPIL